MTWRTELQQADGRFLIWSSPYKDKRGAQRAAAVARSRRFEQTWRVVDNQTGETWEAAPTQRRVIMFWKRIEL